MFETLFIQPTLNALVSFYKLFEGIGLPYAFGFAIVALTSSIRLLFHPFFQKQFKTQRKMSELKPQLDELGKKYKDDKTRLQQAQMDLYKEHGVNPTSGCLFAIIQIPVFIGLYQTLTRFVDAGSSVKEIAAINKLLYSPTLAITKLDPTFFIYNLADSPAQHRIFELSLQHGIRFFTENLQYTPYLAIPLVTGLLQYLQGRYTITPAAKSQVIKSSGHQVESQKSKVESVKEQPSVAGDFQSAMNTQMLYFLPIMIAYFSYTLPLGLSLYWNIFSIFSILQGINRNPNKQETGNIKQGTK